MKNNDMILLADSRKCPGPIDVPTEEEIRALNGMRNIKERVRDLKKRLSEIHSVEKEKDPEKSLDMEREISRLRIEWEEWERERACAARKRMILLGHVEAED